MDYLIKGFLTTSSPIHISSGEKTTKSRGKYVSTTHAPIIANGRKCEIPVVNSGTLRGGLRRAASDLIFEACHAHGVRMDSATLNTLRHGATNAAIARSEARSSDFKEIYNNPHMGIFGGGPVMAAGFLQIGRLYPVCAETLAAGLVPSSHHDTELEGWQITDTTTGYPKIDMIKSPEDRFAEFATDHDESVDMILSADLGRRAKKGDKPVTDGAEVEPEQSSKLRSSNIISYEWILPGSVFYLDVSLRPTPSGRPTDVHAGYLIEALCNYFNNHRVGGIRREGFGAFNLNSIAENVTINDELLFDVHAGTLIPAPGLAEDLVQAYHTWANNGEAWSVEELSRATGIAVAKRGRPAKVAA